MLIQVCLDHMVIGQEGNSCKPFLAEMHVSWLIEQ